MTRKTLVFLIVVAFCFSLGLSLDNSPSVIAIKGAKIIPVVGENIEQGTFLSKTGKSKI